MKAIVYRQHQLPITDSQALYEIETAIPTPGARDLLVKITAISVNPIDTKIRRSADAEEPRILGWDAVGEVVDVGENVTLFSPGDKVYYAGSLIRPGTNAEYHLVDERIVAKKPTRCSDAQAAALPLTALTAWELLFDRLAVDSTSEKTLLIIGAAGGVGSILTQLASKLTRLRVIGTASRPETTEWVRKLGADQVIDHTHPLSEELAKIGVKHVDYVASLTHTDSHYQQIIEVLAPQGKLGLIDDPKTLDAMPLKKKALSLHWELMFTRSLFETEDMIRQHEILSQVAKLVDEGILSTTLAEHYGKINADNLRRAHAMLESHKAKGKIVLEGF
ncbi:zinc-binding alcohol dehydrogenase family protein [Rosenbergiella australiborealis]|uniref:Zinc-type alcohol dehydrogenase-like protein n=1 Tax=Rosenbergiella australiborealis TaxID=1544696 RepID=A0ABS5T490_9GAMM|nr:zinc-binding alcohol dehydrogenase family protein [Rosenbergiella australiborealis]MBT0726573.1 zinc-binding alcohol dehydrogenase family protein [Rosenbergiella australiborealis]